MNRFKVGDKVRIKNNIKYCYYGIVPNMFKLFGTTQIITYICIDGGVKLSCGYTWEPDNLIPYVTGRVLDNE